MKFFTKIKEKFSKSIFSSTTNLVILALLLACTIILSRFLSIQALTIKFGFSFIPIVIAGMLYGPTGGILVAGLADVLGATLFPSGPFFIGFTITAVLKGGWYGFILKKKQSIPYIVVMVVVSQVVGSLCLNSLWISMLYGKAFWAIIPGRIVQALAIGTMEIVLIPIITKALMPHLKKITA